MTRVRKDLSTRKIKKNVVEHAMAKTPTSFLNVSSQSFHTWFMMVYYALMKKTAKYADQFALISGKVTVKPEHIVEAKKIIMAKIKPRMRQQRIDELFTPQRDSTLL